MTGREEQDLHDDSNLDQKQFFRRTDKLENMSEDKLSSFLKTGSDWGRMKTSVPGVFILRLPPYKNSPTRLAIELNPVDDSGTPTKKRGLVLRSSRELEEYRGLFQHDKLTSLLQKIDELNPPMKKVAKAVGEEVLEI